MDSSQRFVQDVSIALGAFFDSPELVAPVAFESAGPFVERSDPFSVRAIEALAAVAAHLDQPDVTKHAEVLGHRRLRKAQRHNDVTDGTLAGWTSEFLDFDEDVSL